MNDRKTDNSENRDKRDVYGEIYEKTCIDCLETKPLGDFYAKRDTKDRHSPYCKLCQRDRSTLARDRRADRSPEADAEREVERAVYDLERDLASFERYAICRGCFYRKPFETTGYCLFCSEERGLEWR